MAASLPLYGAGFNFNDSSQVIPAGHIKFPFVDRWTIPNDLVTTPNGIASSLPSSMHAGSVYTYTDNSTTIPADWNTANLRVVAMLIDNNSANPTYGNVLNSVNTSSSPYAYVNDGVKNVNAGIQNMKLFPNPAQDIAHVQFDLSDAGMVHFTIYDAVGNQVFDVPSEQMNEGGQQINFNTGNLASGIYNVVIRTENGTMSQRLSVVR